MSTISSSPDLVIRVLLMGRKGSGKSSSGNTILGERKFKVKKQHESEVCVEVTQTGEKQVCVIDCPDLLDPDLNKEKLKKMKDQLVSRCSSGLSAVLLTVPIEEPVENEEEILDYIKRLLGPGVQKYIMILFTHGDELEDLDQTIEEHLQDHEDLQRLLTECGGKFHCFNNKCKHGDQVPELLQKIEGMMMKNGEKFTMERIRTDSKDLLVDFSGESPSQDSDEIDVIPERKDQIRLVVLGKTGCGKSATGNTIIGRNLFKSLTSSNSVTKQCQAETTVRFGKKISVIDTPGLYDTELSDEEVKTEIVKCITYASPGPHAFIIVIKLGTFTEEDKNTVETLKEVFGEQMEKYTLILFTHTKQFKKEKKTIEQFLQESDSGLKQLVESCGNRFFCLDNKSTGKDLIKKIEKMVEENGHFANDVFDETEKHIREIQKQKVNQFKQQHKPVTRSEWRTISLSLVEESQREALNGAVAHLYRADCDQLLTDPEEKERAIKEAESRRNSRIKADVVIRVTGKLAEQTMCRVQ